jgi:hypothetical protein
MAVYLPTYCTREDVKTAADVLQTADYNGHIDSAIQAAVDDVYGLCNRRFYNVDETNYWDWPNYQMAYPWRIWFDEAELADVTVNVPVVTTGGTVIPNSQILWGNPRYNPPYTYMELNRSTVAAFGVGDTPQRDVAITGTFGYWIKNRPAGLLNAALSDTTDTTVAVTNAAVVGVGDTLTVDTERLLVSERAYVTTGQVQQGGGCSTAQNNDNQLTVSTGSQLNQYEYIQLDAEVMLITSITGNIATVTRAYDGTVLAAHSGATVYAARQLTVVRGSFGTVAATHLDSAPLTALLIPQQVKELAIAYSQVYIAQKTSAYARVMAENSSSMPGQGLPSLEERVVAAYARTVRQRVI